ncbi:MAG: hypothetical protein AB1649_24205, partial [Chloroflexota bacterium]
GSGVDEGASVEDICIGTIGRIVCVKAGIIGSAVGILQASMERIRTRVTVRFLIFIAPPQ